MNKYIIITETNDEGVIDIQKLNTQNQSIFAFELKKFFLKKEKEEDLLDIPESDRDVILFFKDKIEESFVEGDSSRYQVFDENLQSIEITVD
jgi:hypothetical protein